MVLYIPSDVGEGVGAKGDASQCQYFSTSQRYGEALWKFDLSSEVNLIPI